ncbi:MAG: aconitase X swivel domain-containing protein [Ignavibacteriales bacterium]
MEKRIRGRAVVPGAAEGPAVVSKQPISFWGGVNASTGEVIDRRHERYGTLIAGRVFVFPQGKGSSTASAVLMEAIKGGKAPAAIVNLKVDPILALGAIVADELYHKTIPVVVVSEEDFDRIREGERLVIHPDGQIDVSATAGEDLS